VRVRASVCEPYVRRRESGIRERGRLASLHRIMKVLKSSSNILHQCTIYLSFCSFHDRGSNGSSVAHLRLNIARVWDADLSLSMCVYGTMRMCL